MIRRDYILRMIEEFVRALARIGQLKTQGQWQEAERALNEEVKRLMGDVSPRLHELSESELLARIIQSDSTQAVRDKTLILTALLKELGDTASAQGLPDQSRACYLKALHLLLDLQVREAVVEWPAFVPTIDVYTMLLRDAPLPMRTQAMLMQHYESMGQFARAEDALFAMLDLEPGSRELIDFGISFYNRLLKQSDDSLALGNLPRPEVEAGLAELLVPRKASPGKGLNP